MTTGETPNHAGSHFRFEARLHSITQEAEGIFLFDIRPERGQHFPDVQAGAPIDLHLANGLIRSYSIVNGPDDIDSRHVIAAGLKDNHVFMQRPLLFPACHAFGSPRLNRQQPPI